MGLCAGENKKRRPHKTIIIPKGIINPNENNIIEIPLNFDAAESLIVRAPNEANLCFSVEPYHGNFADIPITTYPATEMRTLTMSPSRNENVTFDPNVQHSPVTTNAYLYPTSNVNMYNTREADNRNVARMDFGSQTYPINTNLQSMMAVHSSSHPQYVQFQQPPLVATIKQQTVEEAHSPLCPICAKSSCKYFIDSSGINGSYNTRLRQFSSPLFTNHPHFYCRDTASFPLPRSKDKFEYGMINKLLDEKVEKILKPLLSSLVKLSLDQEETESFVGSSSYTPKYSWTSLPPKCSKDQCYSRTLESMLYNDYKPKRSTYRDSDDQEERADNFSPSFDDVSNVNRRRLIPKRDSFCSPFSSEKFSDFEGKGSTTSDQDDNILNICPLGYKSCQKRSNLNSERNYKKDIDFKRSNDEDLPNGIYIVSPDCGQKRTNVSFEKNPEIDLESRSDKIKSHQKDDDVLYSTVTGAPGSSLSRRTSFKE